MNWSGVRAVVFYLPVFIASVLAATGYGTYDSATGMFTPEAINIRAMTEAIRDYGSIAASGLASLAVWRGWGRK